MRFTLSVDVLKGGDDETTVDLFRSIRRELSEGGNAALAVKDALIYLPEMVQWLECRIGRGFGLDKDGFASELLVDEIIHELRIAATFHRALNEDTGRINQPTGIHDDEEAVGLAERLVYGWPRRHAERGGAHERGPFV